MNETKKPTLTRAGFLEVAEAFSEVEIQKEFGPGFIHTPRANRMRANMATIFRQDPDMWASKSGFQLIELDGK